MSNTIQIFDTTLRDGEQSPGCSMNSSEKMIMARQLERLGVDLIEAGFAASSPGDFDSVMQIGHTLKGPRVMTLCRVLENDIKAGIDALKGSHKWGIHTFIGTSDLHLKYKLNMERAEAIKKAVMAVELAAKTCDHVEFSAEDSTRSDPKFLVEIFSAVVKAGAKVLNVPDTVGYTTPQEMYNLIDMLKNEVYRGDEVTFSVHCHNDLGLAVANSLAAVRAGAGQVECTVNGIGERAGNASLEEVVMALHTRSNYYGLEAGINTQQIYPSSMLLTKLTGSMIQANKAIVGANAFAHEAGIHQDGVLKNSLTYEIMSPESVGVSKNQLVLGKHSGRAALADRIKELGFVIDDAKLKEVFKGFKALADKKKVVYDDDLELLIMGSDSKNHDRFELLNVNVTSGTDSLPTATVKLTIDGEVQTKKASFGDGPVDAALNTIKAITGSEAKVTAYIVKAISGGTDAQGVVSISIEDGGIKVTGRDSHTDIVIASAKAFVNALNRLELKKKSKEQSQLGGV